MTLRKKDEELFVEGFIKEAVTSNPDLALDKEAFAALRGLATSAWKGLKGASNFISPAAKAAHKTGAPANAASWLQKARHGVETFGRGVANAPARAAGWVGRTAKANIGRADVGTRVGGAASRAEDIAQAAMSSAGVNDAKALERVQSALKNLKPGQSYIVPGVGTKNIKLQKDMLGNISEMTGAQEVHGILPTLRALGTKEGWKNAAEESFKAADEFSLGIPKLLTAGRGVPGISKGIDLTSYNKPWQRGLRRGWNFASEEMQALPLMATGFEYAMANSPEERKEVLMKEVPTGLASSFIGNMAGKRMGIPAMMATYMGTRALVDKIPGLTYQRWGGKTQSEVDSLAQQYGVTPQQVKDYLVQMEKR